MTGRAFNRARQRRSHLEKLINYRHDGRVPETDDADYYLLTVAECYGAMLRWDGKSVSVTSIAKGLALWCGGRAPQVTDAEITTIAETAAQLRGDLPADDIIGRRLMLSDADRTHLRITAIGAYDVDKKAREARRRAKKRARDQKRAAEKRAAAGCQTRAEYLAGSLSRRQPWAALGISKRTYYRRQQKSEQKRAA